jgi:hypothetical protein
VQREGRIALRWIHKEKVRRKEIWREGIKPKGINVRVAYLCAPLLEQSTLLS